MNHALLPSIAKATLPAKYEAAKLAIAEANRIDECKDWADKSAALASYAKQSGDKTMEEMAMRIRARAIKRCGQLYGEFEKATGGQPFQKNSTSAAAGTSRKMVAAEAGLSKRQAITALRVARVNDADFEAQVESDNPPSITALAEQGKAQGVPFHVQRGITRQAFQAGLRFRGTLAAFAKQTEDFDPQDVADGSRPEERVVMRRNIKTVEQYFVQIISKL